jgi:hypothetical protein
VIYFDHAIYRFWMLLASSQNSPHVDSPPACEDIAKRSEMDIFMFNLDVIEGVMKDCALQD